MIIFMGRVIPGSDHLRVFVQEAIDAPSLLKWAAAALPNNCQQGSWALVAWATTPLTEENKQLGWAVVDLRDDGKLSFEWAQPGANPPMPYIVKRDEVLGQLEKALASLHQSATWQALPDHVKDSLQLGTKEG